MPKVPGSDYTSSQSVPGNAPFEQATGVAFGQVQATEIERGGKALEATGLLAQRHLQYIQAEEDRQRRVNDVVTGSNAATEKILKAENGLQTGYQDENGQYVPPVGSKNYVTAWQDKFKSIQDETLTDVQDPATRNALDISLKRMYEGRLIQASHYARVLNVKEQRANDLANVEATSNLVVNEDNPLERDRLLQTFSASIDLKYGNSDPEYTTKLKQHFESTMQAKYMKSLMARDPIKYEIQLEAGAFDKVDPDVRRQINDAYVSRNEKETRRLDGLQKENTAMGREQMAAKANFGQITANELEQIRTGMHPYVKAAEYEHWKKWNDNAPAGEGTQQVRALRNEYLDKRGYMSLDDIKRYSALSTQMGLDLGTQHPELTRFKEELKADWRSITSMDNVEMNKNRRALKDDLDQDKKPPSPFGGPMSKSQAAKEERLRAYGDVLLKQGYSAKDAAAEVRKRRAEQDKKYDDTTQGIIDRIR
jgi:hypothetical protein